MDDSDGILILIFISIGAGVLILSIIQSILVFDFSDKFILTIFIGELVSLGLFAAGILKIRSDLSW